MHPVASELMLNLPATLLRVAAAFFAAALILSYTPAFAEAKVPAHSISSR